MFLKYSYLYCFWCIRKVLSTDTKIFQTFRRSIFVDFQGGCKDSRPEEWKCHSRSLNRTLSMRTLWRTLSFDNQKKTEHWVPSGILGPSITFQLQSKSGCLVIVYARVNKVMRINHDILNTRYWVPHGINFHTGFLVLKSFFLITVTRKLEWKNFSLNHWCNNVNR